jgi:Tol biopolymer transport system component
MLLMAIEAGLGSVEAGWHKTCAYGHGQANTMTRTLLLAGLGLACWPATPVSLRAEPGVTLVSGGLPGRPSPTGGGGASSGAALSANGRYVAFVSSAKNLLDQPLRGKCLDIYVRDRETGTTRLVSAGLDGASGGDGDSWMPAISADGRWVAFQSQARNLVSNATQGVGDIFVRDLAAGATVLVSVSQAGSGGNGASRNPVITPDGRYVLFESVATNLMATPTKGLGDIYLHDLQTGVTTLVSADAGGAGGGSGVSSDASLSADGSLVVFLTTSTNLVSLPTGWPRGTAAVVLRDMVLGTNYIPIVDLQGQILTKGASEHPLLSADGRCLVFRSSSTNLTSDNLSNAPYALYWCDLLPGTNALICAAAQNFTGDLAQVALTPDGQFVAYTHTNQVYLWSAQSQTTTLVSVDTTGAPATGVSASAAVSDDGQVVAFISNATNLTAAVVQGNLQVYVRDLRTGTTRLASANPAGAGSQSDCLYPALSSDGQTVAFEADDGDLVDGDLNHATDVFLWDSGKAAVELVSARAPGQPALGSDYGGWLAPGGLSADGRYVLFTSTSAQLAINDNNGATDVFLHDRSTGETRLVSLNRDGTGAADDASLAASMTPDARYVVFLSRAGDLVAAGVDTNRVEDVYVRDLIVGSTMLASVNLSGTAAGVIGRVPPIISADGRYVAFVSKAPNLVSGPTYTTEQVFLRDLTGGVTTRVATAGQLVALGLGPGPRAVCLWIGTPSVSLWVYDAATSSNVVVASGVSGTPVITPDGRFVAFWQGIGYTVYDTVAQSTTKLLPVAWSDALCNKRNMAISDDGRYLAFVSSLDNLVNGDNNGADDVFIVDSQAPGSATLVSVNFLGTASGNGASDIPRLSGDGRLVIFRSTASDLVPGENNGLADIFVRDWQTGVTRLLSVGQAGGGDGPSFTPMLSADGSLAAFTSAAEDLVAGDFNSQLDVFTAGVPVLPTADSDGDGLPDDWELYYFGDLTHDGMADTDGDGLTDRAEWIAGTNPRDPESALRLTAERSPTDQAVVLSWPVAALRSYRVQYRDSLSDGGWQDLSGAIVGAGLGRLKVQDATSAPGQQRYYRLLVTK